MDESTLEVGAAGAERRQPDPSGAGVSASGTAGGGGDGVLSRDVGRARVRRLEDGERANTRGEGMGRGDCLRGARRRRIGYRIVTIACCSGV